MPDYILDKHSNIEYTLAFYMTPPACAPSPGNDSPPEWGTLARRPSNPPASRSCWRFCSMTSAAVQWH
eukprot:8647627-Pyramimonas_sp.AAC.1